MDTLKFISYLLVMAVVTYAVRALSLALCRGKIQNRFIRSFLAYVPYAVLGAMTFPAVFFATGHLASGIAGSVVGLVLAYRRGSLLKVALGASIGALLVELILIL